MDYFEIKTIIRQTTPKENKDGCYICGSNEKVENNHILGVARLANMCAEAGYEDIPLLYAPRKPFDHCHHVKWHVLTEDRNDKIVIKPEEIDRYMDVLSEVQILSDKVPDELFFEYLDLLEEMADTVERNLEYYSDASIDREMQIKQQYDEVEHYDSVG